MSVFLSMCRSRYARFGPLLMLALVAMVALSACRISWKHSTTQISSHPTAQQLLAAVQKNFATVSSFHVTMQVQNAGPASSGVQILSANGDVVIPDKVKAQANVAFSGQNASVNLISIGNQQFITDPITGQWRAMKGVLDPRTLTNPHTGLISVVAKVQNVSNPSATSVNNTSCWRVTGQLAAKYLAFFTGGGVPANTLLQVNACIGQADALPYQLIVTGRAARSDSQQTTRTFLLSHYNENIQIAAPQQQ